MGKTFKLQIKLYSFEGIKIGDLKYYLLFGLTCALFCSMAFLSWAYSVGITDFNVTTEQRRSYFRETGEFWNDRYSLNFPYIPLIDMVIFSFSILIISGIGMIFSITKIDEKERIIP